MHTLYKYFSINKSLCSTLINNEIWFSNPNNFNDPFDCNLKCNYVTDSFFKERTENLLREAYNSAIRNESFFKEHKILTLISDSHEQKRKEETDRINKQLQDKVSQTGISCFSKTHLNIVMWSHYSDNHRGVCLAFNASEKVFFDKCHEVRYVEDFPNTDSILGVDDNSQNFLFSTKSKDWEYEQEVRVIKRSNSLVKFDPNSLEKIYFGAKCEKSGIKYIIDLLKEHKKYENVVFHRMKLATDSFKLESELINH